MSSFKNNLAKEYTMSGKNRTRFYWLMMVYFGLCGLLMVDTALKAVQSVNQISEDKRKLKTLQDRFSEQYPAADGIPMYTEYLENKLDRQQRVIGQLLKNTSEPIALEECLYRVAGKLPHSLRLTNLKINAEKQPALVTLSFSIAQRGDARPNPAEFVKQWKDDPSIGQILADITLVDRQDNVKVQNQTVTTFTCSATLKRGES